MKFGVDLFDDFDAASPPATVPESVQDIVVECVGIGEAGKAGSAAAIDGSIDRVNAERIVDHAGDASQHLTPDHGRIRPEVRIALEEAESVRFSDQPVTDDSAPIAEHDEIADGEFVVGSRLYLDTHSIPEHRVHTAPAHTHDGTTTSLERFQHSLGKLWIGSDGTPRGWKLDPPLVKSKLKSWAVRCGDPD